MNWLFDSPFTILLIAIAAGFLLGVAWVQTGRNAFLYSIGGVVVVTIVLLIVEYNVKTDGEKVRFLLPVIAADVESNDPQRVAGHIVSSRPEWAARAEAEMSRYRFTDVTIGNIHRVVELPDNQPPAVVVEFNVSVSGSFGGSHGVTGNDFQRFVRLTFWEDHDGQWRIADYEHDEPTAFMRNRKQ
jgi:hypothetical protein